MNQAIFLDRDNTLIANDGDLGDPARVRLIDGVVAPLIRLREAGYRLVVITNQGGVARGAYEEADVEAVHRRIGEMLDEAAGTEGFIERFYYCPFHPDAVVQRYRREHPWRKPNPGMLLQAADDLDLELNECWLIGDQARDAAAGKSAGCRTVLISTDPGAIEQADATAVAGDLAEAVDVVLASSLEKP